MGSIFLSDDYRFFHYQFQKYRYTDARNGIDLHFLAMLVKGTARIVTQEETLQLKQGDVFYLPKGLKYQSYWYGEPEIEFLSFGFFTLPPADRKLYSPQIIGEATLPSLLQAIPTHGKQVDSFALRQFYAALTRALPYMQTQITRSGAQLAERAMTYIRRTPHAQIPEVAKHCGVSQPHLYATFREVTGSTPNDYRQSVLCQLAMELLTTTDKSVEQIATELCFSSAAYLRKVLQKHTGLTPMQIRKKAVF